MGDTHIGLGPGVCRVIKRLVDLLVATLMLLLLAPLMLLIALCVVAESPGSPFYQATRIGRRGRMIRMLKFRKMQVRATGLPLTLADDPRFTSVGRWLAWSKLDELPQLLNVLRGQMSLVGPRPEDPCVVDRHVEAFAPILEVRPGITGLSQLAFAAEGRILDPCDPIRDYEQRILPQKIQLDTLYVTHGNPLLDLRILVWTFARTVLAIPVSVNRSTGRMRVRASSGGRRQAPRTVQQGADLLAPTRSGSVADLDLSGGAKPAHVASTASELPRR